MAKSRKGAHGAGTIRKRPDGRWEARCTVGFNEETGRQIQKSVYGKTQREVREKMTQIIAEIDEGSYLEPTKQTLGAWLDEWLETYVTPSVSSYTLESYRGTCNNHIKPALGNTKMAKLTTTQVQRFYNKMLKDGLTAGTVRRVHATLSLALKQAVKIKAMKNNVAELCEVPKHQARTIKPLEYDEVASLLSATEGQKSGILCKVTLFTGLRQGEVLGLTWDAIDWEKNTILVDKQLHKTVQGRGGQYELSQTKSGKSRIITVAPYVMDLLREQRQWQETMAKRAGEKWCNEWNLVFTNKKGGHLTHGTVYNHFKRIATSVGLDEMRFHDLRHSFAVISLESGDDIKTVQENLGHATASFTMDVYGHVSQKMKQQSAARMEQYIQGVSNNLT